MEDIRWKYRFDSFSKALAQLEFAVTEVQNPNDLEMEGTIQRFEFTHELAWKVMKDFLQYEEITNIIGSRSATRQAFNKGLISHGDIWMEMIDSRNITVHAYSDEILEKEYFSIKNKYFRLLAEFKGTMQQYL